MSSETCQEEYSGEPKSKEEMGVYFLLRPEERIDERDEQDQTKKVWVWCGRDGESRVKFLQ